MTTEQTELIAIADRVRACRIDAQDVPVLLEALIVLGVERQRQADLRRALDAWATADRAADIWGEDIVL